MSDDETDIESPEQTVNRLLHVLENKEVLTENEAVYVKTGEWTGEPPEYAQNLLDEYEEEEREQLTQRMPPGLVADIDELADDLGVPRNAAINLLVKRALKDFD